MKYKFTLSIFFLLCSINISLNAAKFNLLGGYDYKYSDKSIQSDISSNCKHCANNYSFDYLNHHIGFIRVSYDLPTSKYGFINLIIGNQSNCGLSLGYGIANQKASNIEETTIGFPTGYGPGKFGSYISIESQIFRLGFTFERFVYDKNTSISIFADYSTSASSTFDYYEQLIEPKDEGVFKETGTRKRNELNIQDSKLNFSNFSAGININYYLPISENHPLCIVPYAGIGINSISISKVYLTDQNVLSYFYNLGLQISYQID